MMINLKKFIAGPYLHKSFRWVAATRLNYSANDSIWSFKRDYKKIYNQTIDDLCNCTYRFEPVKKIFFTDKAPVWVWDARDAWVLKALTLCFQREISPSISRKCSHVKGNGGITRALSDILKTDFKIYKFVFKSDVKSFYESMSHDVILRLLHKFVKCRKIHDFFKKFLKHLENEHALLLPMTIGISKGCPVSPLLGALYLSELDEAMSALPVIYCRFMDDWCVLAKTRWELRDAIKLTNQILVQLKVQKHPNKTFIGRTEHGFDFLGFHIESKGITDFSRSTKEKILSRLQKLYEHHPCNGQLYNYITGVQRWSRGVLRGVSDEKALELMPDLLAKYLKDCSNDYNKLTTKQCKMPIHLNGLTSLSSLQRTARS